jgi:hypothetical protein
MASSGDGRVVPFDMDLGKSVRAVMKRKRQSWVYVTAPCMLGRTKLLPSSRLLVLET